MARPNVTIAKGNGTLGGIVPAEDGTSLLVISAPAAYPVLTSTVFLQLSDAEAAGATAAADLANNVLVHEHIKDFYSKAAAGTKLHVLIVAATATMVDLFTVGHALNTEMGNYISAQAGEIKLLGAALNPSFLEVDGTGITADLLNAIPLAQAFSDAEYDRFRPVQILLEGRRFAGTIAAASDLRGLTAPAVSIAIGRDEARKTALVDAGHTGAGSYAALGFTLGKLASVPVQRNIGRVRDGELGWLKAALSGGQLISTLSDADLDTLHDKGYIFALRHAGKTGFYFNDDNTCAPLSDDYCQINRGRVIDKASRIARRVYLDDLLDEVAVDPANGQLAPIVVKTFETSMTTAITDEMVALGEAVGVRVSVDPNQDVLATGRIEALVEVLPYGIGRQIQATVQFINPANN
jgi:hypothetical protein